jgi:hypothetical protein
MSELEELRREQAKKFEAEQKRLNAEKKRLDAEKLAQHSSRIKRICRILDNYYVRYRKILSQGQGRKYTKSDTEFVNEITNIVTELWNIWLDYGGPVKIMVNNQSVDINDRDEKKNYWNNWLGQPEFVPTEENWKLLCNILKGDVALFDRLPLELYHGIIQRLDPDEELGVSRLSISQSLNLASDRGTRIAVGHFFKNLVYKLAFFGRVTLYYRQIERFEFSRNEANNNFEFCIIESSFYTSENKKDLAQFIQTIQPILDANNIQLENRRGRGEILVTMTIGLGVADKILKELAKLFFAWHKDNDGDIGLLAHCKYLKYDRTFLPGLDRHFTVTSGGDEHTLPPNMFHNCISPMKRNSRQYTYKTYITRRDFKEFINSSDSETRILIMYATEEEMREKRSGWFSDNAVSEITRLNSSVIFGKNMRLKDIDLELHSTRFKDFEDFTKKKLTTEESTLLAYLKTPLIN